MPATLDRVSLSMHDLGQAELDSLSEVLKGTVLTAGETVNTFEQRFANILGIKHALSVTSGTAALHLSFAALGIAEGDEVITTPITDIATVSAILESGAKPVFVDVEPETGNIDASKIEAAINERTCAILPTHLYGQMCDMRSIRNIADQYGVQIIEDSAQCIEGERDGIRPGQLGDTACFSLNATQGLTCGEGGVIATNDTQLFNRLQLLRTHGVKPVDVDSKGNYTHWDMVTVGWQYNMDNIRAALLLPQLDRLESNWQKRDELAAYYRECLSEVSGISRPAMPDAMCHAWHVFPIWIKNGQRDNVMRKFQERDIDCKINYPAVHLFTYLRKTYGFEPGDFPVAEQISNATLCLPFYPSMPLDHADLVVAALKEVCTH